MCEEIDEASSWLAGSRSQDLQYGVGLREQTAEGTALPRGIQSRIRVFLGEVELNAALGATDENDCDSHRNGVAFRLVDR
jgi:hypothetical protein